MEKLALSRLDKVYCRLGVSGVHGVGIFAIKNIPEGINPFSDSYMAQDAVLVSKVKVKCDSKAKMLEDYFPTGGNNSFIVPLYPNQPIWTNYLNYTSDPLKINMELDSKGVWRTTRIVSEGEELLEDPTRLFNEDGSFKVKYVDKYNNDYLFLRK